MDNFFFEDRVSTYPNRYKVTPVNGGSPYQVVLERADVPIISGTPMSADTFNTLVNTIGDECGRLDANQGKSQYNLGAFDTWVDNGDGTVTITRQTGYICFDGVNAFVTNKASNNKMFYTPVVAPYISCPNSSGETAKVVSNYLVARTNDDVYEGVIGITVGATNDSLPELRGSICVALPNATVDTTVDQLNGLLSQNPLYVQYKLATPYTENVSSDSSVGNLDQRGSQWARSEWERGLNLFDGGDISATSDGSQMNVGETVECYIQRGKTYTLSAVSSGGFSGRIDVFDNDGSYGSLSGSNIPKGFTFVAVADMVKFKFYACADPAKNTQTYTHIMLNEGSHAYPYQPFSGGVETARTAGSYPNMTTGFAQMLDDSGCVYVGGKTACTLPEDSSGIYVVEVWQSSMQAKPRSTGVMVVRPGVTSCVMGLFGGSSTSHDYLEYDGAGNLRCGADIAIVFYKKIGNII